MSNGRRVGMVGSKKNTKKMYNLSFHTITEGKSNKRCKIYSWTKVKSEGEDEDSSLDKRQLRFAQIRDHFIRKPKMSLDKFGWSQSQPLTQ